MRQAPPARSTPPALAATVVNGTIAVLAISAILSTSIRIITPSAAPLEPDWRRRPASPDE